MPDFWKINTLFHPLMKKALCLIKKTPHFLNYSKIYWKLFKEIKLF